MLSVEQITKEARTRTTRTNVHGKKKKNRSKGREPPDWQLASYCADTALKAGGCNTAIQKAVS